MRGKRADFFDQHAEKLVLGAALVLSVYIFFARVVFSPNTVPYDGQEFRPGQVDVQISEDAKLLQRRLNAEPEVSRIYSPRCSEYVSLLDSSIRGVDLTVSLPQPSAVRVSVGRKYRIPRFTGQIEDVAAEHIRAAAYVPVQKVTLENANDPKTYESNDIDFVTVEGKLDTEELLRSFKESFAGASLPERWRDPCLASPVFAAVELQRQRLLDDGGWSDWQRVPRSLVEPRSDMFEITEDARELPAGGITVRVLKFAGSEVQRDLLQPEAYSIASANEEWFPPLLHKRYVASQRELEVLERREARAAAAATEKEERSQLRDSRRSERRTSSTSSGAGVDPDAYMQMILSGGGAGSPSRRGTTSRRPRTERRIETERSNRPTKQIEDVSDYYDAFEELSLGQDFGLSKMEGPLVFWAHDDTAEPGQTYQYHIRLGVFNPVAGTDQIEEQDMSLRDDVILWSGFSDATESIAVPARQYFFPVEVQEVAKAVDVQVSKYQLGYWRSEQFMVKRGETIGKVVANSEAADEGPESMPEPARIDYSTGAMMVEIVPVNDWTGGSNLHSRRYFDMLYSYDGETIERVAAKVMYWPDEMRIKYNEIRALAKETKEPLRPWGERRGGAQRIMRQVGMPESEGGEEWERMMMEMLRGRGR